MIRNRRKGKRIKEGRKDKKKKVKASLKEK
jgi:hypothetical protein